MARTRSRIAAACAAAAVPLALTAAAEGAIRDHPLPVNAPGLSTYYWENPIAGWNGALWLAASQSGDLLRIDVDGRITSVAAPRTEDVQSQDGPSTLSPGTEGLWFLMQSGRVAAFLRPDGTFGGYRTAGFTGEDSLVARPGGGVYTGNNLGETVTFVSPAARREYPRPHGDGSVVAIGAGGVGWFAQEGLLVRANDDGTTTTFPLVNPCQPSVGCALPAVTGLALGPDGRMWYTRSGLRSRSSGPYSGTTTSSATVGRVDAAGRAREWDLANNRIAPSSIVAGPDGNLWFATADGLGRVTPAGRVRLLRLPGGRTADSIAFGPDRAIWFTDSRLNRVSRITMREANALGGAEIRSAALRRRGASVPVKITCPAGGPRCTGRVVLGGVPNPNAVFGRLPLYGSRAFVLRPGRSATVAVAARAAFTAALRRSARIAVRVEIDRGVTQGDVVDVALRR
ncbi:MAG: hypothetical protein AB7V42_14500 [Thermoleophilia bacterium]